MFERSGFLHQKRNNDRILWHIDRFYVPLPAKHIQMKYRIKKENKPTLTTFGKYKAVAVHQQTIDADQLYKEAAENHPYDEAIIKSVMIRVAEVANRHLRNGDKVRIKDWGMMKLEIKSDFVDNLKDFKAKKHIRGVRLHFLPESANGSQALYEGIDFEKDKSFPEE